MQITSLLFLFLCFLFLVPSVHAHLGGGPPFVQVEGKYAENNPFYQGKLTLYTPQDVMSETYLVNKPITFSVDITALTKQTTIPAAMAKDLTFRWTDASGDNFEKLNTTYHQGSKTSYTFAKPGSYLIILEGKSPLDADYSTLDTIQVNVVPTASYQLPNPAIFIGSVNNEPAKPVVFVSQATVDPSTRIKSISWDFGEGRTHSGKQTAHLFSDLDQYAIANVAHRVIDQNGLMADVGLTVENVENKLQFKPLATTSADLITIGNASDAPREKNRTWILAGSVIAVIVLVGFFVFRFFAKNT